MKPLLAGIVFHIAGNYCVNRLNDYKTIKSLTSDAPVHSAEMRRILELLKPEIITAIPYLSGTGYGNTLKRALYIPSIMGVVNLLFSR